MKSKNKNVQECLDSIIEAVEADGPYSHNIITINLNMICNMKGHEYADKIVDQLAEDYGVEFYKLGENR